jgi:hypothetical protein
VKISEDDPAKLRVEDPEEKIGVTVLLDTIEFDIYLLFFNNN